MYKTCSTCKQLKALEAFSRDKSKTSGYKYRCKSCEREYRLSTIRRRRAWGAEYQARLRITNTETYSTREELIRFYLNTPKGLTVDHIIPLSKGGLHCLTNLQYLTGSENSSKRDSIPE